MILEEIVLHISSYLTFPDQLSLSAATSIFPHEIDSLDFGELVTKGCEYHPEFLVAITTFLRALKRVVRGIDFSTNLHDLCEWLHVPVREFVRCVRAVKTPSVTVWNFRHLEDLPEENDVVFINFSLPQKSQIHLKFEREYEKVTIVSCFSVTIENFSKIKNFEYISSQIIQRLN